MLIQSSLFFRSCISGDNLSATRKINCNGNAVHSFHFLLSNIYMHTRCISHTLNKGGWQFGQVSGVNNTDVTVPTFRSRSQLLLCWCSNIIKSHMWFLYPLIDLSVTAGNCGAQQYHCCAEHSSDTWVPTCKNLHKSTRFRAQCCVQDCLRQVHLFMASRGPLAAELGMCETPLHPLTLAVEHQGKSNALHSHASTLHHMFLSDVKQGDKRLPYLINSPHRAPDEPKLIFGAFVWTQSAFRSCNQRSQALSAQGS